MIPVHSQPTKAPRTLLGATRIASLEASTAQIRQEIESLGLFHSGTAATCVDSCCRAPPVRPQEELRERVFEEIRHTASTRRVVKRGRSSPRSDREEKRTREQPPPSYETQTPFTQATYASAALVMSTITPAGVDPTEDPQDSPPRPVVEEGCFQCMEAVHLVGETMRQTLQLACPHKALPTSMGQGFASVSLEATGGGFSNTPQPIEDAPETIMRSARPAAEFFPRDRRHDISSEGDAEPVVMTGEAPNGASQPWFMAERYLEEACDL